MPKLGADMTEGRVVEWLKQPGEPIARGEVVLVIETDKANVEVESWTEGRLEKILVAPGDEWLPVGTPLAVIAGEGAVAAPPPSPAAAPATAPAPAAKPPERRPAAPPPRAGAERVHVSPIARKRADELKLDLATIVGTGPDGRITLDDVERDANPRSASVRLRGAEHVGHRALRDVDADLAARAGLRRLDRGHDARVVDRAQERLLFHARLLTSCSRLRRRPRSHRPSSCCRAAGHAGRTFGRPACAGHPGSRARAAGARRSG